MLKRNDAGTLAGLINLAARMSLCAGRNDEATLASLAGELCREHLPAKGWIIDARVRPDGAIAARIKHEPRKHKPAENPRIFDSLFFAAFLIMGWCGFRLSFHVRDKTVDGKDRYYLRAVPPRPKKGQTHVRPLASRIVCDALSERDAQQEGDHHSYRYKDLVQLNRTGRLPAGKNGRAEAIEEARKGFERKYPNGLDGITADEIAKVLARLLETATAYHGKQEG